MQRGNQPPSTEWLEGNRASAPSSLAASTRERFTPWRYLVLGFTHIVPYGLDHMLFVPGIYLVSRRVKAVLYQVCAFTIAHSITLGLSMYGVTTLPPQIIEPAIAISIACVAVENLFLKNLKSWRVPLVFALGLLHGMGLASVLKEVGPGRLVAIPASVAIACHLSCPPTRPPLNPMRRAMFGYLFDASTEANVVWRRACKPGPDRRRPLIDWMYQN